MSNRNSASSFPNSDENGDDFRIEGLFYFDGPWDMTVRPPTPERVRQREADRANIERFVAWAKLEQEKLDARSRSQGNAAEAVGLESNVNEDDDAGMSKTG
jgi:hypothetical protein